MFNRSSIASLAAVQVLAGSISAHAAEFMIRENSAAAVGMSYAGAGSRADGANTVFSNPAGMTNLQSNELEFAAALIIPDVKFQGNATAFGSPIAGNNGGNSGRLTAIPSLYGNFGVSEDLKLGFAVTVPFGNGSTYDSQWYGRYLGTKTTALSYDINAAAAYRLNDRLSLGAGISAQYLKLDVSSAINQSIIFAAPVPDAINRFVAHDWAVGFNLGVLAKLSDATRIGLTYRSGVDHDIQGSITFTGASPLLGLISGPASAEASLPSTFGASVTSDLDSDLTIYSDVQFTQWSVFKDVIVKSLNAPVDNRQNYRDNWMISLGARYKLDDRLAISAGLAWDQTPVVSAFRTVNLPDTDRYLLGVGSTYQLTDSIVLDGAYGHSFAFARPNMDVSANNTDSVTHAVVLKGRYDVAVDIVGFSLRYRY